MASFLHRLFASRVAKSETGSLSSTEFIETLRRERARTDRNLSPFCVVCVSFFDEAQRAAIIAYVSQRLRSTDQVGWLPDGRLGVFLPDTPTDGGQTVATDLACLLSERDIDFSIKLYCYPTDNWQPDRDTLESTLETRNAVESAELLLCKPFSWPNRVLDVIGASVGLLVLWPLMLTVGVLIKLTSPGPIVYRQWRVGLGGRLFRICKFRTMVVDAEQMQASLRKDNEQDGPAFKMQNDPRVTPIGRLMRRLHIDELPQLWNVIRGDMSLVGPRPLPADEMNDCQLWQRERLLVRPGLTCFWQVRKRQRPTFADWMRMDVAYVRQSSTLLDIRLIAQTIWVILTGGERLPAAVAGNVTTVETPEELAAATRASVAHVPASTRSD